VIPPPASPWCLRWQGRKHSWRHTSEGGFDRRRYDVARIGEAEARAFVEANHYTGTYPAARRAYGLFDGVWLVGVLVLSIPVQAKVLTDVYPGLVPYDEALELGRLVLADVVPAPAESFFIARVWRLERVLGLRGVVSFSDPVARTTLDGRRIFPGHVGVVYQASNALALGRGTPRTQIWLPDGAVVSQRTIQKIRRQEPGARSAERFLVGYGARPRRAGEEPRDWLREAWVAVGARRVRHPGCWRFGFSLDTRVHVAIAPQAYPCPCEACRSRETQAQVRLAS
jgi:hypothetical protein